MKISRWILLPLIFGLSFGAYFGIFYFSLFDFILGFVAGSIAGLILQFYSDYKARKVLSNTNEESFEVRQNRKFVLFYDYDRTFDLCLESISHFYKGKIKHKNYLEGIIKAKTGMNLNSFGTKIVFKLTKITEGTTEVEVSTIPIPRTVLVDYGESLGIVETLKNFFQTENNKKNLKILQEKVEIPINTVSANDVKIESDYK